MSAPTRPELAPPRADAPGPDDEGSDAAYRGQGGRGSGIRRWFTLGATGRSRARPRSPHLRVRRRRLLLASLPVVVLLALVATRLVTLNLVHNQTLAAYQTGDQSGTATWGERQGWVNVVEQFRSPFAIGDSYVLAGRFDAARPWFEQAFTQVPKGGIDDCKVRVNLGLTYEALGDAAKARERTAEWKQFYAKGLKITRERPKLCDAPEGGNTGKSLQQTQQRLQSKSTDPAAPPTPPEPQNPSTKPKPNPKPTPGQQQPPSEQRQQQLKDEQRRNTSDRNRQRGDDDRTTPGGDNGPTVDKPW